MDTDEYLVPMGDYRDMKDLLKDLEKDKIKIYTFKSQRSNPRFDLLTPPRLDEAERFEPEVSNVSSFFETYNCHRENPRVNFVPAEKQIYKPDYVLLHHVHYSTVTVNSQLNMTATMKADNLSWRQRYKEKHVKVTDEETEALMLHTKSVVYSQTTNFEKFCRDKAQNNHCKLGFPWPDGRVSETNVTNENGFLYNCFVDEKIESFWVPKLKDELQKHP